MTQRVYMPLVDEGVPAWRPIEAVLIAGAIVRVDGQVPSDERWAYQPGQMVHITLHRFASGVEGWAIDRLATPGEVAQELCRTHSAAIQQFIRTWRVRELSLFGSVLRDDFRPDSDIDVLLVFEPEAPWSYWDYAALQADLEAIFKHRIDVVEKQALTNPFRRHRILTTRKVIYRAA